MSDSVAVDAKRILLRYGAPIAIMDQIQEKDRITLARTVSRTPVPERGIRLRELLVEHGYLDAKAPAPKAKKRVRRAGSD